MADDAPLIEALRACREIVFDELEAFIENNSEHTKKGKRLDRKSLTGYEREELERLERAVKLADAALDAESSPSLPETP